VRQRTGIILGVGCDLRERDITGRVDEFSEVAVGTGVRSIQNLSTVTRCAGASSG
jgi:hypothetical protein